VPIRCSVVNGINSAYTAIFDFKNITTISKLLYHTLTHKAISYAVIRPNITITPISQYDQHATLQDTVKYQRTPVYRSKILGTLELQLTQFQGHYVDL
jgi:hypothetical protein